MKSSPTRKAKAPDKKDGATLSTRITGDLFTRVKDTADAINVGHAELVREGLARVLAEFSKNGTIRFGRARKSA